MKVRKVSVSGSVIYNNKEYFSESLWPYIGQLVLVMADVFEAAVIVHSHENLFICNARNPILWQEMVETT